MNNTLQAFARQNLKDGLAKCTKKEQHMFKHMYSYNNLNLDINVVVNIMDEDNLDVAMVQVQRTLDKKKTL